MKKRKCSIVLTVLLLLPLALNLIQHVKATENTWSVGWHNYVDYGSHLLNLSTTTVVSGANGHCTNTIELVVSVSKYGNHTFTNVDFVEFKVLALVKAVADPGYQPQYATNVIFTLCKIDSNQVNTYISMLTDQNPPGYSQGYGLDQKSSVGSTEEQRVYWVLEPIKYAIARMCEPLDIAFWLVDVANSFASTPQQDFQNAGPNDPAAYSWWYNPGYYFSESPVRQFCFNCFEWKQDINTCPSPDYGLEISAYVEFYNPNVIGPITTLPIYLRIYGPPQTLSISVPEGGGTTNVSAGTHTYYHGSVVTVKAVADNLYLFDYWNLDGATRWENPITVTMDSDHTLKAYFRWAGGGGGGGCPTLFVWNGTSYESEGILNIHAESDITVQHQIQNTLALQNGIYKLQLWELDNYTSHIDQVKLYAVDSEGEWHLCPLIYAKHSELGIVTWKLWFDDENRIDLTPTQVVSLRFLPLIPYSQTVYFIFEINGYNQKPTRTT